MMIVDAIKQHFEMILICGLMFLSGVGVGGAITDAIYRSEKEDEKKMDSSGSSDRSKRNAHKEDDENSR